MKTDDVLTDLEKLKHELRGEFSKRAIQEKTLTADAKGDIDQIGLIRPAASQTEQKKKEKKRQQQSSHQLQYLLISIQQTKIWLSERMEQLQEELGKLSEKLNKLEQDIYTLQDILKQIRQSGSIHAVIEEYENNELFRKQVEVWEKEKDKKFDPYSDEAEMGIREILQNQMKEKEQLLLTINEKDRELDRMNTLFENLEEMEEKVQTGEVSIADVQQTLNLIKPKEPTATTHAVLKSETHLDIPLP